MNRAKGPVLLTVAALIWGTAFVAQSVGMDHVGPFTFNAVRSYIGAVALLPMIGIFSAIKRRGNLEQFKAESKKSRKTLLLGGLICGIFLCVASLFQQTGIQYTTVGKAGFLTALYIVIVPLLGIFLGRRPGLKIWISVIIALAGTYFLSMKENFSIDAGDIYVIMCAVFFSFHILLVDRIAPKVDGVKLSCIQFFVSATLSLIMALIFEKPEIGSILSAWQPLLYTGIMSSGVAYTLQIIGQRGTNPAVASLIMSMESLFSAVSGWLILGEELSGREIAGCALVFVAVVLSQLPSKTRAAGKSLQKK